VLANRSNLGDNIHRRSVLETQRRFYMPRLRSGL
jgi:hypothetical protein